MKFIAADCSVFVWRSFEIKKNQIKNVKAIILKLFFVLVLYAIKLIIHWIRYKFGDFNFTRNGTNPIFMTTKREVTAKNINLNSDAPRKSDTCIVTRSSKGWVTNRSIASWDFFLCVQLQDPQERILTWAKRVESYLIYTHLRRSLRRSRLIEIHDINNYDA